MFVVLKLGLYKDSLSDDQSDPELVKNRRRAVTGGCKKAPRPGSGGCRYWDSDPNIVAPSV